MALPTLAFPGQLLGPTTKYTPGPGTYVENSQIHASLFGPPSLSTPSTLASSSKLPRLAPKNPLPTISISRPSAPTTGAADKGTSILPEVDSVVLARVSRLTRLAATVEILVVGDTVCSGSFQGQVRVQDVRATEKDRVKIGDSFRVGDVVRGIVISLGDQASYYISTASNELGVVMAVSEAGNTMYPISWKEFKDPKTGLTELRKVAKPF
ncbi:hypothetical protein M501DRAFT_962344 [Patellaria atrata CBS 101060]|uniref:S1 motif domain-containing protein n=1 Tax=Patellaria atrata CBS 101060 TaxID=1346257 RepID=A0A9P4S3A0_9PEZI|nr:hypothetical protein M501DRAFT_962344 [Patellaria atrata CBS 101060]